MSTDQRAEPEAHGPAQTLVKGLRVLEAVGARPGGTTLAELSRALPYAKSTIYRLAATLEHLGYLVRLPGDDGYRLGVGALRICGQGLHAIPLSLFAGPYLDALVRATGESSHVGVLDGTEVVYVGVAHGPHRVRPVTWVGMRLLAHATATGKAILAFSPEAMLRSVLASGLVPRTPNTITREAVLRDALTAIRLRGYATDDGEESPEVRCIAAPVFGAGGAVVGAIGISAPASRLGHDRFPELGALIRRTASDLSAALGHIPYPDGVSSGDTPPRASDGSDGSGSARKARTR